MKTLLYGAFAMLLLAGCDTLDANTEAGPESPLAANGSSGYAEYQVRVRNLTSGQPFTPPLAVTHSDAISLFNKGEKASYGIQQIAENGNLDPLIGVVSGSAEVADWVVAVAGTPPPVLQNGGEVTFTIKSAPGKRYFSFASMLICTNDGFTGVNSIKLPRHIGDEVRLGLKSYDAGTEINTEDFADIVPPCQGLVGISSDDEGTGMTNPALAENGYVHHHPGVDGDDDLVAGVHGFGNRVGKIAIRRIR